MLRKADRAAHNAADSENIGTLKSTNLDTLLQKKFNFLKKDIDCNYIGVVNVLLVRWKLA